jgi:membrane dipeptidase
MALTSGAQTMQRREFLYLGAAGLAAPLLTPRSLRAGSGSKLYGRSIVIDGLGFPGSMDNDQDGNAGAELSEQEVRDVAQSGLTATHLTVGEVGTMAPLLSFEKIIRDITRWDRETVRHPNVFLAVRRLDDIIQAKNLGKTGLIYGLQDGVSFEDDVGRLAALQHAGVRVIQPTYNRRNLLGDGCMETADAGLSRAGAAAIEQIQQLGMLVDLSHCGRRTAADAIALAKRPVSFTHTGCFALAEHPRHRTDAELKAVADTGGVSGIFIMPYLSRGKQPTAADVIAHLRHAIDVAGEDHVSLGTDGNISPSVLTEGYKQQFREITRMRQEAGIAAPFETEEGYLFASDLNTPRRFETLAELLLDGGFSPATVEKILGANLLRVFGDSWNT